MNATHGVGFIKKEHGIGVSGQIVKNILHEKT